MALKYIPIILFLIFVSILIIGCKSTSLTQCNSASPQDNFYCYVPRILPGSGVPMKWFPCGQNDKGTVHKSCRYNELDEECFIFVRAEYKDGNVRPLSVEVTPMKLIDKDPDKVDMTKGPILGEFTYPVEYFYVNKRDLLDTKNQNIYQGKKIKVTYLFKDPFLAYQTATLYDSAYDGTLSPEVREKFTVDSVRKGCTRILGKSLCDRPEFAASRCNTIPCPYFTDSRDFKPFLPDSFINKYAYPNIYPLLKYNDNGPNPISYIMAVGDRNRYAYINVSITKNLDHTHQFKFRKNNRINTETIIDLDPESADTLSKEYIRFCGTDEARRIRRYVIKIPLTFQSTNRFALYDKALEKDVEVYNYLFSTAPKINDHRELNVVSLNGSGLNAIANNDSRFKVKCRTDFNETVKDAFCSNDKKDLKTPIPINLLNPGIYFSLTQTNIPVNQYFDNTGNMFVSLTNVVEALRQKFPQVVNFTYTNEQLIAGFSTAISLTYMDISKRYNATQSQVIFYANDLTLASRDNLGVYKPIQVDEYGIPKEDAFKFVGSIKELTKNNMGMTGPFEGRVGRNYMTVCGVFKDHVKTLVNGSSEVSLDNAASIAMIHEFGHLWNETIMQAYDARPNNNQIDNLGAAKRHSFYCTGINSDICIFRYDPPRTKGNQLSQYSYFNKVGPMWCESHYQIILNTQNKFINE